MTESTGTDGPAGPGPQWTPWQPPPPPPGGGRSLAVAGWVAAVVAVVALIVVGVVVIANRPAAEDRDIWAGPSGAPTPRDEPTPTPTANSSACGSGAVVAGGLPALSSAMSDWTADFQRYCPGTQVTFRGSGVGDGVQMFNNRGAQLIASDGPLAGTYTVAVAGACDQPALLQLPVAVRPVGVAYNLDLARPLTLWPQTVAAIFTGRVTRWNDPVIAADNPGLTLPNLPISVVRRSDAATTTEAFTAFLHARAKTGWAQPPDAQWPAAYRAGTAVQGGTQMVDTVKSQRGSIGYGDWADLLPTDLKLARVVGTIGEPVALDSQTVAAAVPTPPASFAEGVGFDYERAAPGGYPIITIIHLVSCDQRNPALAAFLLFVLSEEGQAALDSTGLVKLPEPMREAARTAAGRIA